MHKYTMGFKNQKGSVVVLIDRKPKLSGSVLWGRGLHIFEQNEKLNYAWTEVNLGVLAKNEKIDPHELSEEHKDILRKELKRINENGQKEKE